MWAAARTHHYDLNMIMWRYVNAKTPEEESPFVQNKSEFDEVNIMDDFGINEMLEMQKALQDKYKDIWEKISPEIGQNKLLWMIGEIGEVIDIIKKYGGETACEDEKLRACLIEELADVLMYYNDVLLCYGISTEELKQSYVSKFEKNMKRW